MLIKSNVSVMGPGYSLQPGEVKVVTGCLLPYVNKFLKRGWIVDVTPAPVEEDAVIVTAVPVVEVVEEVAPEEEETETEVEEVVTSLTHLLPDGVETPEPVLLPTINPKKRGRKAK